jgi:DNA-binding GntR family transcriptional regulator
MQKPLLIGQNSEPARTKTKDIYDRIRRDILFREFKPDEKLKLESLKSHYGVSVNTLRETLPRLVSSGLVVNEGQRGFRVMSETAADLEDITNMRQFLECHGAELSIQNTERDERARLNWESQLVAAFHKLEQIEPKVETRPRRQNELYEAYNREFHTALISACESLWLKTFHEIIFDHSLRYRMSFFYDDVAVRRKSHREHAQILNAALSRDIQKLGTVLNIHIRQGMKLYGKTVQPPLAHAGSSHDPRQ